MVKDSHTIRQKPGVPVPWEWGDDPLTDYFATAHFNRLATLIWASERFAHLIDIDECFDAFNRGWMAKEERAERWLLIRAHGAYRSACEAATATMVIPAFNLIRLTIETAAYALHIARNAELHEVWLDRSKDDESKRRCRKAFAISRVRTSIDAADAAKLIRFDALYEEAIDWGAHPNELGMRRGMKVSGLNFQSFVSTHLLMVGEGQELNDAMDRVRDAGLLALELLGEVFPERYDEVGISQRLTKL